MPITRLVYVSEVALPLSPGEVQRIHAISQRNNRRLDITGALGFTGHYFIQLIEGRQEDVDGLMGRIAQDRRHRHVVELEHACADKRCFGLWSMRYFDSQALDRDARHAHQATVVDTDRARWLVARMAAMLPPGDSLEAL